MGWLCDWFGIGCTNTTQGSQQSVTADVVRYTKSDDKGWLRVLVNTGGDDYLCEYTKVRLLNDKDGRTYFEVLDGTKKGMKASLKKENALKFLDKIAPEQVGAELAVKYKQREVWHSTPRNEDLDQQWAELTFNGATVRVTLNSVWNSTFSPIPPGRYKIRIPDTAHNPSYTAFYRQFSSGLRYDTVWFPIEYEDNSRYVHVGHLSEGCVTSVQLDQWNAIYKYLISHRIDELHVGNLIVTR